MRTARNTATREESDTVSESFDTGASEGTTVTGTRTARTSRRGFGGYNNLNKTTFQLEGSSAVLVFLDPENFSYAKRHWIKYMSVDEATGKPVQVTKVEYCLEDEDDCPLCEIGDRAKPTAYFNVVDVSAPSKVLVCEATPDPTSAIQKEYNKLVGKGKHLSDDNMYWVISKEKGKNGFFSYSVDRLSEDDMASEWEGLSPITATQREALRHRAYDDTYILNQMKTRAELQEFVDSLG